jgi:hypothetical protein
MNRDISTEDTDLLRKLGAKPVIKTMYNGFPCFEIPQDHFAILSKAERPLAWRIVTDLEFNTYDVKWNKERNRE